MDTTISNTGNYNYAISGLAQAISGYTFDAAYRDSGLTQRITSITASRTYHNSYGGWYSSVVNFLNGNTSVENTDLGYNNSNAGDIYLIYRGPALEDSHTTVHYGYMNGTTFVEFEAQPAPVDPRTSHHTYLIYDFEGYQYAATDAEQYGGHTYYRTTEAVNGANMRSGATQIQARLAHNNANGWRYRETGTNSWTAVEDGSHIYVVYSRMPEATQGGTPTVKPSSAANPPANPSILKESASNHDGTNKLGLSIRSDTADLEVEKLADVIVVFDVSGSMSSDDMGDDESRLSSGRDAINALANKLLNKTNTSGDKLIRMGLITFSTDARVVQPLTDDEETFRAAVDRQTTANGGTNWEKALNLANQMSVDSGRATFVIFVTDGDPTFRVSRMDATDAELQGDLNSWDNNDTYYVSSNVFGQGSSDNQKRNYNAALKVAQSIIGNRKTFYTIGISSDVTHLNTFADDAGAAGKYTANNSEELTRAFDDIQASIVALMGWGDINMTDGITSLTNTVEKSGLTVTDGRFEYWKAPAPANWSSMTPEQKAAYRPAESDFAPWTPSAERAQEAVYEDGAVKWDMGHDFMPAAGVTYKVTFNAWPSQEAYDWIADLSNGTKTWSDVVAAGLDYPNGAMPQIVNNGDGTFSLKTNQPGANTTYRSATKSGEAVSTTGEVRNLDFNDVDPMPLAGEEMKVRKEWDDSVNTGHTAEALKFRLLVDGKYYQNDGTKTAEVGDPYVLEANTANSWTDTVDIAPGIVKIAADGTATVYETGHEYKIEEYDITGGTSYYDFSFEYTSQTVRPMVLNGTLTYLVKVEPPVYPAPDGADTFTIDGREYYAAAAGSGEGVLTGTNHKTSELDITKIVNAAEGSGKTAEELEEETFTYRVTLTFPEGANIDGITPYEYVPRIQDNAYTLYGYQTGETAFPSDIERFSGKTFRSWNTSNATVKSLTTTNADGTMTAVIDMTLKQTEVIRFTNLPTGTTYVIQEIYANKYGADTGSPNANKAPVSDPCNLTDKGYTITQVLSTNGTVRTTAVANDTVSGTISGMNTRYYNQFTNLYTAKPVRLVKVDPDRRELDGASFTLNKINVNGTPEQFRTGIVVGDTILSLPAGDYELVEEDSPDGYIILAAKVYFRMDALGHVTLLDPDTREAIEPEDDVSAVDPAELRYTEEDGFTLYVINTPGEVLPMTGGAGTTGFVIIGAILMIGAGVVLAARRRMSANE